MGRPALVYLADLSHDGVRLATESFPYNVGLVAAYAKKHLGDAVEFRLFKYVSALCKALRDHPPDILGCSNYVWNSNLSEWALGYAKRINHGIVTVQGGTNYPFGPDGQIEFLAKHPNTDLYVYYEGEVAFLNLLRRFLEVRHLRGMKEAPIAGCQFLSPRDGSLMSGQPIDRLKSLDEIPSPYVTGLLDEFFDGRLTPMMETTRGCPFKCNFCNAGDDYFDKVNMFSLDYVVEEIRYIAPRISAVGVSNLTLADNNFGMYRRDADICRVIKETQETFKWPVGIIATTGKNNKERIIKATEILGNTLLVNMSVQSMDKDVLVKIKRDNISLKTYTQVNEVLTRQGRSQNAEIIVPLPGETYESFMRGVQSLIDAGANKITSYTLQLLYGTDYKDPEYRREHGYEGKWRIIPLDFGEYEGERIFDVEEVAVSSRSLSFEDYLLIRGFAFVTEALYNNYIFWEILRYLKEYGISAYTWLRSVWDRRGEFPDEIKPVFESFMAETKSELWDTESELMEFYRRPENYGRLLRGEIGGNVLYKHKAMLISRHIHVWIDFVINVALDLIRTRPVAALDLEDTAAEVEEIRRYLCLKLAGVLNGSESGEPITARFSYDVLGWVRDAGERRLSEFARAGGVEYRFYFNERQMIERKDDFGRYGVDLNGLAKVLARVPSHDRLFRQVSPVGLPESLPVDEPAPFAS
jgi:radical SAM superfamily enzyme YgiQ (UPF0313 family)